MNLGPPWLVCACLCVTVSASAFDPSESDDRSTESDSEDSDGDIEVVGSARVPGQTEATGTKLDGDEAAETPGVGGDPVKALPVLGGISRMAPSSEGLAIWGASPAHTRLYVDDIPVSRLFHVGSARSVLPSSAVADVTLVPTAPSARYGRGLGGVVAVTTRDPLEAPAQVRLSVDPVDVGIGGHVRGQQGWIDVNLRHSLLQLTAAAVAPERSQELVPIPTYSDGIVRIRRTLRDGDVLGMTALFSDDRLQRGIPSVQPDRAFSERLHRRTGRVGLSLDRQGEGATRVVLWGGLDRDTRDLDYGTVSAKDDGRIARGGLLLTHTRAVGAGVQIRAGLDGEMQHGVHTRVGALAMPAREGDVRVFGQPPGDRINADTWRVTQGGLGAFVTATAKVGETLELAPGLRVDSTLTDGDRVLPVRPTEPAVGLTSLQWSLDPRVRVSWSPWRRARLYAVGARVHQPSDAADRSPVFGNPALEHASGWHSAVGVRLQPYERVHVEAVGFTTFQRDLAVRAPDPTPALARLLVTDGQGRNRGVQLTASARGHVLNGRVAYTFVQADRRSSSKATWRPYERDPRHGLQLMAGAQAPWGLSVGARLQLASGAPRTPVIGAVYDTRSQRYDPLFGAPWSERLPAFASLSARVSYTLKARKGMLRLWLDGQNLTKRANVEEIFYSPDYAERGEVFGLPTLVVAGFEVRR